MVYGHLIDIIQVHFNCFYTSVVYEIADFQNHQIYQELQNIDDVK